MIQLRDYQTKAVDVLFARSERMLNSSEDELCIFKSPTGSGKTIVVAELLRKLVSEYKSDSLSFVWIAPRKLHDQSKDKLERIYYDQLLKCSNFDDLQDNKIDQNEILFFNWESINKKNNIYIMDNEDERNLSSVVRNTKDDGQKIVLIIDESHYAAGGEKSLEIIHDLAPKITFEVSATPQLKESDENYKVRLEDVINEEMIKDEVIVNPEFLKIKVGSKDADDIVIQEALKKRDFLKKGFEEEKSNVNPLVLIQLPDKRALMEDKKEDITKILKEKYGITEENGKLAIWLSDDKSETLPNIEKNDNDVEVLIFKQAISIGWDCPRASILVVFREYKSFEFTIQTIGRIMRMPELKHYSKVPELNKGYIFTNLENIELAEEYVKDYISLYESNRNESLYKLIKLKSTYFKRQRERTRLSSEFSKIFNSSSITKTFKSNLKKNPSKIIKPLLSDGVIPNIDKAGEIEIKGKINVKSSEKEIQRRFDEFVGSACSPFAPHDSSDRLKTALYTFLEKEHGLKKYSSEAQQMVLGIENYQLFWDAINQAKSEYATKVIGKISEKREEEVTEKWEVPKTMSFKGNCIESKKSNCIMKPFYSKKILVPEQHFIERLSISKKVKWWYKNGESEKKYFSVPYVDDNGKDALFFVDFIIQFNDGIIGLFDTKSGGTAKSAGTRHNGLYKYLKDENKKGKNLIGGIIVESSGTWKYCIDKKYHFDEKNLSSWKILEF